MTNSPLLILGASVRAAAQSARRADYSVFAADLFADWDLRRCCPSRGVVDYPTGLAAVAETAPPGPWMFTGGLENHAELVAEISRRRRLLGNPPDVLRAVRDPRRVKAVLQQAGLAAPQLSLSPAAIPQDGSWLQKPLRGSGGAGIRPWCGGETDPQHFFQEQIAGDTVAAVYVAAGDRAVLLGATRQLVGSDWTGARGFVYCGSLGPLTLSPRVHDQFIEIGQVLTRHFRLVGLLGVDAVVSGDRVWTIEINPRYTASVEVLERALGWHAVEWHLAACLQGRLPAGIPASASDCCGKAIVYARQDVSIGPQLVRLALPECEKPWPDLADVPDPGTPIRAGRPITTVLSQADDEVSLSADLRRRVLAVENIVYRGESAAARTDTGG